MEDIDRFMNFMALAFARESHPDDTTFGEVGFEDFEVEFRAFLERHGNMSGEMSFSSGVKSIRITYSVEILDGG